MRYIRFALTLAAALALPVQAAEYAPAATPAASALTVIAQLTGRTWDTASTEDMAKLKRALDRFTAHWPADAEAAFADPSAPTNAELAAFFVERIRTQFVRPILASEAARELAPEPEALSAAQAAAAADMQ